MAKKQNFQVDKIGINVEHYAGWKEADFIADIIPGLPDRFGTDAQKKVWAKGAYEAMTKANPVPVEKVSK